MRWIMIAWLMILSVAVNGQTAGNYISQARFDMQKNRYASAIGLLNRAIQQSTYNSEAFFLRGIAKYELEDFLGAEKDFGKALELNPKNHEAFLYRGVCRSQQFNYKEAFSDFNQSIRLNDEDWRTYSNRALASLQLERYVDVIADCNKVISLKKQNAQTYLIRGEAKMGLEMYNVALQDFEYAMTLDSTAMHPVLYHGMALAQLQKYEDAIADFERAMELDPQNKLPVFHRAGAYVEMGRQKQALKDLNDVLSVFLDNAIVLFNRAMILTNMKRPTEALTDYDRVLQLNPNNILGFYNRANLLYAQKQYRAALADYNKAIELFPEFMEAQENRIELYGLLKDQKGFDKAVKELEALRQQLSLSDENVKLEQNIKLLKLTQLKGDFEPVKQEVGKIQQEKVDIRLLPFYKLAAFPESDPNISVYDGFHRPHYSIGTIALTTQGSDSRSEVELRKKISELGTATYKDHLRLSALYGLLGDFTESYAEIENWHVSDDNEAAYHFARASMAQMEMETLTDKAAELYGDIEITDTTYQKKIGALSFRAEMDYRKVIELDPEMSFAHFNLAHVLVTAERYEEAETQFGLAAATEGNFIEANYNRGLIRIFLGKTTKGCEDLSLAGELGLTDSYNIIKRYCE